MVTYALVNGDREKKHTHHPCDTHCLQRICTELFCDLSEGAQRQDHCAILTRRVRAVDPSCHHTGHHGPARQGTRALLLRAGGIPLAHGVAQVTLGFADSPRLLLLLLPVVAAVGVSVSASAGWRHGGTGGHRALARGNPGTHDHEEEEEEVEEEGGRSRAHVAADAGAGAWEAPLPVLLTMTAVAMWHQRLCTHHSNSRCRWGVCAHTLPHRLVLPTQTTQKTAGSTRSYPVERGGGEGTQNMAAQNTK